MVDDSASLGVLAFVEAGECIRISSPRSSERKVEIGLAILLAAVVDVPWSKRHLTLAKPEWAEYMVRIASGSAMTISFGAIRTMGPYFSCRRCCVFSELPLATSMICQKRVIDAGKGPGYRANGWIYLAYTIQARQDAINRKESIAKGCIVVTKLYLSIIMMKNCTKQERVRSFWRRTGYERQLLETSRGCRRKR